MRQQSSVKAVILGAVLSVVVPAWTGPGRAPGTAFAAQTAAETAETAATVEMDELVVAPTGKPAAEVDAALRRVIDAEYQTELPHERAARVGRGDPGRGRLRGRELYPGRPGVRAPRTYSVPAAGGLAQIASLVLWMLVGVAVVMIVFLLVQGLRQRGREEVAAPEPDAEDDGAAERAARVVRPLGDAEALAAQGRYAEAIHALLLRTIEELARTLPTSLPHAFTSREIVRRVPMPPRARDALSELVAAVELCYFGARMPGAAEYHTCRARFQEFASAYVGGAAA